MSAQIQDSAVPVQRSSRTASLPVITLLLIAVNVLLYAWQILHGVDATEPEARDLIRWGANVSALTLTGDYWRLPASMFLHIGATHLLLNMVSLWFLGALVERNFGKVDFIVIYILAGLGGAVVSALWNNNGLQHIGFTPFLYHAPRILVTAGASGAIMGLAAAGIALRLVTTFRFMELPAPFSGKSIIFLVVVNIVYGVQAGGTDNASHMGGLIAGAVAGLALAASQRSRPLPRLAWRAVVLAAGLGLLFMSIAPYAHDPDLLTIRQGLEEQDRAQAQAQAHERQREAMAAQARAEAAQWPAPVDMERGAGTRIELPARAGGLAFSADGRHAYVTGDEKDMLSIIDIAGKKLQRVVRNAPSGQGKCSGGACQGVDGTGVAVDANEKFAYVTSSSSNLVATVDLATGRIMRTTKVGNDPMQILLSPDGKTGYVMNVESNNVSFVDLAAGASVQVDLSDKPLARLLQGSYPSGLALSADGKTLFAIDNANGRVAAVDTATRAVRSLPLQGRPFDLAMAQDGNTLAVMTAAGLELLDPATLKSREALLLCDGRPRYSVSLSADGKRVAVADYSGSIVRTVSLQTRRTLGLYFTGPQPRQVAYAPGTNTLLVLDGDGVSVSIFDERQRMAPAGRPPEPDADPGTEPVHAFCWPGADEQAWPAN